jgi:hypothetical protein
MKCIVALCVAVLFAPMTPASAESGRVVGGGVGPTPFGTNPGGKYIGSGRSGTNPGGKYVYRGRDAKFHTNPGGKYRWYGNSP